jgi:hypothetical protein
MGWSCTTAAARTIDRIEEACSRSRLANGGGATSNVFYAGGKQYFYEVSRRDQPDGGIAGTLYLSPAGVDWARKVGTFRLDGHGNVVRGPALFRRAVADSAFGRGSKSDNVIHFESN